MKRRCLDDRAHAIDELIAFGAHVMTKHANVAARRRDEPEQHADRGRLAGAVSAEEAAQRSAPNLEIEPIDSAHRSEFFCEPGRYDDGVCFTHMRIAEYSDGHVGGS